MHENSEFVKTCGEQFNNKKSSNIFRNLLSNPSEYAEYANTIESLCVRRGCNLTVYDDGDFSDDPFSFVAKDFDLCVTLDSPPSFYSASERAQIKGLDDSIRSMTLKCNNRPSTLYTEY